MLRLDAPGADLFARVGEGKRRSVLEDVALVEAESFFDVDGALAFEAEVAFASYSEAIFDWFG